MKNLQELTIAEMHKGLKNRHFSAIELTEAHLRALNNDKLNACVLQTPEIALEAAKRADQLYKIGENLNNLLGIPIGIKDVFCTKGVRTTACSNILKNFVPNYESTVSTKLWERGAVMIGKLNMDEFAMGVSNTNSCFGPVKNPLKRNNGDKRDLIPGGSSGGSAASVAGFLCASALGSDTGGSVRHPAAFCGIVGIKPTYGRCSRWGMVSFSSSCDQAGILARSVCDAAFVLEAICGYDCKDTTSSEVNVPKFSEQLNKKIKGIKIGIPREYLINELSKEVKDTFDKYLKILQNFGAEIIDISLPHTEYSASVYSIITSAEAAANLSRYDGVRYGLRVEGSTIDEMYEATRASGFGSEVKRRIITGSYVLSSENYKSCYQQAQKVRRLIAEDFVKAFSIVDYMLTPTTYRDAFDFSEDVDLIYLNDIFVVPSSLAGLPAIAVPAGISARGMPLSLQIIGNHYDESGILNIANIIEQHENKEK